MASCYAAEVRAIRCSLEPLYSYAETGLIRGVRQRAARVSDGRPCQVGDQITWPESLVFLRLMHSAEAGLFRSQSL